MFYGSMGVCEYFSLWYPLPRHLPLEVRLIIYAYVFNQDEDPW